ncbi:putative transcriptional regulator [Enterococcus sp. PF1-24]|uniref:helix-turn-helix transcriptional regulator n=1 Tax=unclassified Enterococcus TaxID=2608891 RepID=UPI00247443AB|nr:MULTISPECIES: helix-turn-helix transcriptional regulator [unclassified Enterococcus]MDH6363680.1 putative transcriptional regulator [Enterococcus sp. PFB1-1]MDH6400636.1 putative transcriptional regulator [Enterococcus sp. PF1-24]
MIVNRIRVLRAEHEWSQAELAERVGVSRQAIISIEKYKYTPSLELAFRIAKIFNVDINDIFKYMEEK